MPKRITPTVCCEGPVQNMQLCLLGCTTPLKQADNLRACVPQLDIRYDACCVPVNHLACGV